MGGGNNAYIHLHRRIAPHAIKLAIGQYAQQTCLYVQRHIADLVEEQRAAVCLLESPLAHGIGAGKGPFLVAKQF